MKKGLFIYFEIDWYSFDMRILKKNAKCHEKYDMVYAISKRRRVAFMAKRTCVGNVSDSILKI